MDKPDEVLTGHELKMLKASLTRAEDLLARTTTTLQNAVNRLEELVRAVGGSRP